MHSLFLSVLLFVSLLSAGTAQVSRHPQAAEFSRRAPPLSAPEALRFDFETGDLQGWKVVEGQFDRLICDWEFFHNQPDVPYNKQGRYYLNTLELSDGSRTDAMTGVLESPVFILDVGTVSFLIGGGSHRDTYMALCADDGSEVRGASGKNTEVMQRITWDVDELLGKRAFLRIVDGNRGGWGHVTFDDFRAHGQIDWDATLARREALEEEQRAKVTREKLEALNLAISRVRAAVDDLSQTFVERYPRGTEFRSALDAIAHQAEEAGVEEAIALSEEIEHLTREALLANPLVSRQPILYVVRPQYREDHHSTATMFQTGEINTASFRGGASLKSIHFGEDAGTRTLLCVAEGIVRDPDVSFDGQRVLFSMRRDATDDYHLYEMNADGSGLRQLTFGRGLSDIDPVYLPSGEIVFSSTREPKYCQCNRHIMANLFKMDADGGKLQQIGRNTLFEGHPSLMPDGRILYDRWEYVDKHFGPAFGLWTMNPDGTNHALYYGNNAWSPGAILDARVIQGTERFVATFGSCHDRPWGAIVLGDRRLGLDGIRPISRSWPENIRSYLAITNTYSETGGIDYFRRLPVKYEDPYPLSDKYFLCSRMVENEEMGIFLLDSFGNEILLHREDPGCYDPMPISPRLRPPVIPSRVDPAEDKGYFYLVDVYQGYGMERVRPGAIKYLRVVEAPAKLFWTHPYWGIDAQQGPVMNWNCTNNKCILGDVPVESDGSAHFAVPADKFIFFQALDENRMMIQSMRSGTTVRPGETIGCVGCHEARLSGSPLQKLPLAMRRMPSRLEPWYGPPREFNYLAEVQPVFDRHCVRCHDFGKPAGETINLAGDLGLAFNTSYLELRRKSAVRWFPESPDAKKLLVKAVDDGPAELLPPYSWGSHRSRLVDVVRENRCGGGLDKESLDRIVTWIDMNAPYYGSYASAYPDNPFGRSPLNDDQLRRLSHLVGREVGTQQSEMQGAQVNSTRPELSLCLTGFQDKSDPRYKEALAIIQAGKEMLAQKPRADMPGFKLVGIDFERQRKHDAFVEQERRVREEVLQQGDSSHPYP